MVPHSGGIGLNEYTQHLSLVDYICVSGRRSLLEHINTFSQVLTKPLKVVNGYFVTPWEAGYSVEFKEEALVGYEFPSGMFWASDQGVKIRQASYKW